MKLYDDQAAAVEASFEAWGRGLKRPALVEPTGWGKTVAMAAIGRRVAKAGGRFAILAHRDELISQAMAKINRAHPELAIGRVQGTRREVHGVDGIVASVQSLGTAKARAQLQAAGLSVVMVDECHHATAPSYLRVLEELGAFDASSPVRALGVTATMSRSDGAALGNVWEEVVHHTPIKRLIKQGRLRMPRGIRVRIAEFDAARVRTTAGDYSAGDLGRALEADLAIPAMCRAYAEHAKDRQGIAFWPTVAVAQVAVEHFADLGIKAAAVWGSMPIEDRRRVILDFVRGEIQVISNCGVMTEGTDLPNASAALMGRMTKSAGLYVQMAGRVLRRQIEPAGRWPIHKDALIIDPVGVGARHRLATIADLGGGDLVETLERDGLDDLLDDMKFGYEEDDFAEPAAAKPEPEPFEDTGIDGALHVEEFSLFDESDWMWQRTGRGVWFLHAGSSLIFLAPGAEPGRVDLCEAMLHTDGGRYVARDLDGFETAMRIGEELADSVVDHIEFSQRHGAWRDEPSFRGQWLRLGLSEHQGRMYNRGEADDMIRRQDATARIDGMVLVRSVTEHGYW